MDLMIIPSWQWWETACFQCVRMWSTGRLRSFLSWWEIIQPCRRRPHQSCRQQRICRSESTGLDRCTDLFNKITSRDQPAQILAIRRKKMRKTKSQTDLLEPNQRPNKPNRRWRDHRRVLLDAQLSPSCRCRRNARVSQQSWHQIEQWQ